jgi:hypothetical protein
LKITALSAKLRLNILGYNQLLNNKNIIVTGKSKCISIADLFFNELNIFPVFLSEENLGIKAALRALAISSTSGNSRAP